MAFDSKDYIHPSDKAAMNALKMIPGFHQFIKGFMKIWSERQFRISNMSSCVRINERQLPKYYEMLPPICEKLGIEIPELYLQLDVSPNAYTYGDTKPFIVITSGLFETIPEELVPTVLAHECGHIACHHVLYTTMGSLVLGGTVSALRSFVPLGGLATMPLQIAFYYWMRCSELSADRAAVLYDGDAEKMSDVCMRLAGYDKDIQEIADKKEFMAQAREYKDMSAGNKWDKTLEFLILRYQSHPLMAVRALECEDWAKTDCFRQILDGTYHMEEATDDIMEADSPEADTLEDIREKSKKEKVKLGFPIFRKKQEIQVEEADKTGETEETDVPVSVPDEIRKYKELMDDGIITQEEFSEKKRQLLNL